MNRAIDSILNLDFNFNYKLILHKFISLVKSMGGVANVLKNKAGSLGKIEAFGVQGQLKALRGNAAQGLGAACPLVNEVKDVVQGIS